jgi:hypothetical protein
MPTKKLSPGSNLKAAINPAPLLAASEVQSFLDFLFSDLAKKRRSLSLRKTAPIARYLMLLAKHGVPKKAIEEGPDALKKYWESKAAHPRRSAQAVELVAKFVWEDLLRFGDFPRASNEEAREFLQQRRWHHPALQIALEFLEDYELPTDVPNLKLPVNVSLPQELVSNVVPTRFVAKRLSEQGGNPYLDDDLSQRVAAADCILKQAGIRVPHRRIAEALNASPLTKDLGPDCVWGSPEVRDRVKSYFRQKRHLLQADLAAHWMRQYRLHVKSGFNKSTRADPSP